MMALLEALIAIVVAYVTSFRYVVLLCDLHSWCMRIANTHHHLVPNAAVLSCSSRIIDGVIAAMEVKNDIGVSEALKLTDMTFQRARTRWRMHRSPIASHQYRMNIIDSPICRQCRSIPRANESDQHALLECSKHRRIRSDMLHALQARVPEISLSIPLILGHTDTIAMYAGNSKTLKKFLYNTTGQFIKLLCENRVVHVT